MERSSTTDGRPIDDPPVPLSPEAADDAERRASGPRARRPLVLVAEDNSDSRDLLDVYLGYLGCRVVVAKNGREAVELAAKVQPDLLLLDMSMPGMDGLEVARRLRADERTRDLRIIAVTAFGTDWSEAARAAGCNGLFQKPVFLEDLERVVDDVTR